MPLLWTLLVTAYPAMTHAQEMQTARTAVQVTVGSGQLVRLGRPATTVFVADPQIADVQTAAAERLFVFGKKPGRTTLFALDERGEPIVSWQVQVEPEQAALTGRAGTEAGPGAVSMEASPHAYAAANGMAVLCVAEPAELRAVLATPPETREAFLASLGSPLAAIAHLSFGAVSGVTRDADPRYSAQDKDVHAWLDALGGSVSDEDKKQLAQMGDDAATLKSWFDAHKRGDPALNDMPQNVADAENRLFANDAVAKQLTVGGLVTRDALGAFINKLDSGARSATDNFEGFKANKNIDPASTQEAVDASILQANFAVLDAAGGGAAKVDGKIDANDLRTAATSTGDAALPTALKNAAGHFADSTEFDVLAGAGGRSKDGTANDGNLGALQSDAVGLSRQDSHVRDWLDSLGSSVSDSDKQQLAQTADDLTTVKAWFDAHSRGDPALNNMPKNVADAENRLFANDAVAKQLTVGGLITRDAVGKFLDNLNGAADSAKKSFESFKSANPNADPIALQEAVAASIVQANLPVIDAAGSDAAKVDGKFNFADLRAVASSSNDAALPAALKQAAGLYANAGQFQLLSNAGLDVSSVGDGLVSNSNLDALVSRGSAKDADEAIARLKNSAIQQIVADAGGDPSKVGADYFSGGTSNASGADKTAELVQLSQTLGRLNAGVDQFKEKSPEDLKTPEEYHENYGDGPTPGEQRAQLAKDVQSRIDKLSQDPDVQKFLSDTLPGAFQAAVAADPAVKAAIQADYDAASSPQALKDAFANPDGKLSTTDMLSNFVNKAGRDAAALGINPDFSNAFAGAPQEIQDKIKQGHEDIVSGKRINDLVAQGVPQDKAIVQATVEKTVYDSVLDKKTVADGTDRFDDAVNSLARSSLTDGQSVDAMLKGIGAKGVDDPKLLELVQNNLDTLAPPGPNQPSAADIVTMIRQVDDGVRNGLKFDDAMAKAQKSWKPIVPSGTVKDAYKAGVFHGASALLLAGAMGARLAAGGGTSGQTVQQSLQVAGLLTKGGAKYYATTLKGLQGAVDGDKDAYNNLKGMQNLPGFSTEQAAELAKYQAQRDNLSSLKNIGKDVENVGKGLGGVAGNALGLALGAIGAKQAAESGDTAAAGVQGTFAGLNGISAIAGIGEVATYAATRIPGLITSAAGEALAATLGGLIYLIVSSILADEKLHKQQNAWYKEMQDGFASAGLTLPPLGTLIDADNGTGPIDEGTAVD